MHARRYARTQNETASPERLMALLFDAASRHMRAGAAALEAGRPADANAPLARAAEIVMALHDSLDPARAPQLAGRLPPVYRFVCERLLSANARGDAGAAREAERAFAPVAQAFTEAVARGAAGEAR